LKGSFVALLYTTHPPLLRKTGENTPRKGRSAEGSFVVPFPLPIYRSSGRQEIEYASQRQYREV
jgi:hypothetical protein